jgi:aminopeptidase-like protein
VTDFSAIGDDIHQLAKRLWPIPRSLTGDGVRHTLAILRELLPQLQLHEVPTGTACFDWQVPQEWNIRRAWIMTPQGEKICQFSDNNLHVLGYSIPVERDIELAELQEHLFSLPDLPDAIPYVTSYYRRSWGFCITERQRSQLTEGTYRVVIDSTLEDGHMSYADLLIPGESDEEILLSTYVCHPAMANNELSGPCVTIYLAKWLLSLPKRQKSYRLVFIPETIGSIYYISRHLDHLKRHVKAGYIVNCIGDERCYSFMPSRAGDSISDRVGRGVLAGIDPDYKSYSFLERGSDERQYCYPGVDLPIASLMRSKYAEYPEYHTSLDDLSFVTPRGLQGGFDLFRECLNILDSNRTLNNTTLCEPQLGKRGLYSNTSTRDIGLSALDIVNVLAYCDGKTDLFQVSQLIKLPYWKVDRMARDLEAHQLLVRVDQVNGGKADGV